MHYFNYLSNTPPRVNLKDSVLDTIFNRLRHNFYYLCSMKRIPYTGTNQAEFKKVLGDRVLDPYFCMGLTILSILTDDGFVNVQEGDIVVIDDDGSIRIE